MDLLNAQSQDSVYCMLTPTTCILMLAFLALLAACTDTGRSSSGGGQPQPARASTTDSVQPSTCGTTGNLHVCGEVYLAGQPGPQDFAIAQNMGVRSVINLRHASEVPDFNEQREVEALGMTYIHIPWKGEGELTDDVLDKGRAALNQAPAPIMLHCATANRVGPIWMAWRVIDRGVPIEQAAAEARTIGLKTPGFETKARDYIRRKL